MTSFWFGSSSLNADNAHRVNQELTVALLQESVDVGSVVDADDEDKAVVFINTD